MVHSGVAKILDHALAIASIDAFSLMFVSGDRRSGKSHFAIKLSDCLVKRSCYPTIFQGDVLKIESPQIVRSNFVSRDTFYIIDDAQDYFSSSSSGEIVTLIEHLRFKKAKIVFLSLYSAPDICHDDHVSSRIRMGAGFQIESPNTDEFSLLIDHMARQRGIKLKAGQVEFLYKRLEHDLASIEQYFLRVSELIEEVDKKFQHSILKDALENAILGSRI